MPRWILLPFALVPPAIVLLVSFVATVGNTASLGRVPIPGERTLDLDAGKVTLHYEERRNLEGGSGTPVVDEADFLEIPRDLEVRVRDSEGADIPLESIGAGSVEEQEDRVAKAFAKMELPRDGRYTISARPIDRRAPRPAVTLGPDKLEEFRPWGIGAAIALAVGFFAGVAVLVSSRR